MFNFSNILYYISLHNSTFGKGLLEYTISEALKRNVETIFLEVRVSNTPARNLYQRFDFEEIGKRKYFYSNPIEDAICMSKSL